MPVPVSTFGTRQAVTTIWSTGGARSPSACDKFFRSNSYIAAYRKICETGQTGSSVVIRVPEGKFASEESQAAADQAAIDFAKQEAEAYLEENGYCIPDGRNPIFSNLRGAINWDWVANRDRDFPHTTGYVGWLRLGDNRLLLPLQYVYVYDRLPDLLDTRYQPAGSPDFLVPNEPLQYTLHPTFGYMHIKFTDWMLGTPNFAAEREEPPLITSPLLTPQFAPIPMSPTNNIGDSYYSFAVGDFNSQEAASCRFGNGLFEIVTSKRKVESDGKVSGSYFISYLDRILVWKYNELSRDYEILFDDFFDPRGKTTYFAVGIYGERSGSFRATLYVGGVKLLAVTSPDLLYVKPCPYIRNVVALDYWFGDIFSGVASNCAEVEQFPELMVVYKKPTSVEFNPEVRIGVDNELVVPSAIVRTETTMDSLQLPPYSLAGGYEQEAVYSWANHRTDRVISVQGRQLSTMHTSLRFDYVDDPEVPKELFAATMLCVGQYWAAIFPKDPFERWDGFFAPMEGYYNVIRRPLDTPFFDPETIDTPEAFDYPAYTKAGGVIRDPCWDGISYTYEAGSERSGDIHEFGPTYRVAPVSIELLPENKAGLVTLEDLANSSYLAAIGWYAGRSRGGDYSEVRGICFKTGIPAMRTREALSAPAYPPIPPCEPRSFSCSGRKVLMMDYVLNSRQFLSNGFSIEIKQFCDSLFPGMYSVNRGGWNWEGTIEDIRESETIEGHTLYSDNYLIVTLRTTPEQLMADGLWSSSQLLPLSMQRILLRVFPAVSQRGTMESTSDWQPMEDWLIPIFEIELPRTQAIFNVPPPSPGGGSGAIPPEVIQVYNLPIPTPYRTTVGPPVLDLGILRFEIFRAGSPDIPILEGVFYTPSDLED